MQNNVFVLIKNGKVEIPDNVPKKDSRLFSLYANEAYAANRRFWGRGVPLIRIRLAYTRKEYDALAGSRKSARWVCATTLSGLRASHNGDIIIFAPSVFTQQTGHKLGEYPQILIHEINHVFYFHLMMVFKPVWAVEGIARVVAKQNQPHPHKIDWRYVFYSFKEVTTYKIARKLRGHSYLIVKRLLKRKGKTWLMNFLAEFKKHPNKSTYEKFKKELLKYWPVQ